MIQIDPDIHSTSLEDPLDIQQGILDHFRDDKVSVSLKYFKKSCECFKIWKKDELKGFSNFIEKLAERNSTQVKSNTSLCHAHKGSPSKARFSRPEEVGDDIQFYSIRITDKARVHGFFVEPIFFLVWLDKKHECLKV